MVFTCFYALVRGCCWSTLSKMTQTLPGESPKWGKSHSYRSSPSFLAVARQEEAYQELYRELEELRAMKEAEPWTVMVRLRHAMNDGLLTFFLPRNGETVGDISP